MSRRPTGWSRWFRVETRKIGGPDDDCWGVIVRLLNDNYPVWNTVRSTEKDARKDGEFRARQLTKIVKACMAMEQEIAPGADALQRLHR